MSLTISATELGAFGSRRFCPRCAWIRHHVKDLPFRSFPGIFSSIDRYNKLVVAGHYARESYLPRWLDQLGEVSGLVDPPHWSKFKVWNEDAGVTLRGEADAIFKMSDGSFTIVDYKTARYTDAQRGMFREYEVQLNAYAYIGERLDLSPVRKLALVYMEPQTDEDTAHRPEAVDATGFSMGFRATVVPVDLKPEQYIPGLLEHARKVFELEAPPPKGEECGNCAALSSLLTQLG